MMRKQTQLSGPVHGLLRVSFPMREASAFPSLTLNGPGTIAKFRVRPRGSETVISLSKIVHRIEPTYASSNRL
jgi:hypothetical protein